MQATEKPNLASKNLVPLLLSEREAAALLDESPETRRVKRYEDKRRLLSGQPISGPAWIQDGKRIKYRLADLQNYVDSILAPNKGEAR